jgi:hypothetical protein
MSKKISRRRLLKGVGAAGAGLLAASSAPAVPPQDDTAQLLAKPSTKLIEELQDNLVQITAGEMLASFDRRFGTIHSIVRKNDPLQTNYVANTENSRAKDPSDSRWTGNLVTTVWDLLTDGKAVHYDPNAYFDVKGRWQAQRTGSSRDIRRVHFAGDTLSVDYDGESSMKDGIRSFRLSMSFSPGTGSSLLWKIEIQNVTNNVLEIGELGLPLMFNDDYAALLGRGWRTPVIQKMIHEQKVLAHHFVAGHSSYVLVQRPLGDPPFLLVHPLGDTPWECIYPGVASGMPRELFDFGPQPGVVAIHSWAVKNQRHWFKNPWVNGHTSAILAPGEKKSHQVRFAFIDGYEAVRDEVANAGNLGIRVIPSMVVQEEAEVYVELKSQSDIGKIKFLSDNITVKDRRRVDGKTLLTLSFKGRGQKSLKLHYGAGRWTNLHFYCIEDAQRLLRGRAAFIVDREFCQDPDDPYHRYHCFLPFDHRIGSTYLDSDDVWEVGGSDEAGFSEPLFLAEKNAYIPNKKEIETLETYVDDCLFKYIQDPKTYLVRASLYWKERYPSAPWGWWTRERAESTFRTYNYVHPACIYYALYRIGKYYGLVSRRTPQEYLRMAYHTAMKWFTTGPYRHIGLMEGSNANEGLRRCVRFRSLSLRLRASH